MIIQCFHKLLHSQPECTQTVYFILTTTLRGTFILLLLWRWKDTDIEEKTEGRPYQTYGAQQQRQNENHNHRKLTNLITWTTALSKSMKLWAMSCRATQDGRVMVETSDKTWSTGDGNGKPLQYSCLENPINSMKRHKDRTLKDELPRLVGPQICYWRSVEK